MHRRAGAGRRNPIIVTIYELAMALGVSYLYLVQPDESGIL
jgi:hypothetical protein